ncbi:MAG: hypothetical protein JXR37_04275 [Kiritimatiellae bacterium]|nr:hypothetical protein [Kiritimatiellia bacterium]
MREWTDRALAWLQARAIKVRGHHLLNARLNEADHRKYARHRDSLRRQILAHMAAKLGVLGKRVGEWDAISHIAVCEHSLETLFGSPQIYVEVMRHARRLAPEAKLWVNEGTILPGGMLSQTVLIGCRLDDFPTNTTDGTVYKGTNQVHEHVPLTPYQPYYYTIWLTHDGIHFLDPPP